MDTGVPNRPSREAQHTAAATRPKDTANRGRQTRQGQDALHLPRNFIQSEHRMTFVLPRNSTTLQVRKCTSIQLDNHSSLSSLSQPLANNNERVAGL